MVPCSQQQRSDGDVASPNCVSILASTTGQCTNISGPRTLRKNVPRNTADNTTSEALNHTLAIVEVSSSSTGHGYISPGSALKNAFVLKEFYSGLLGFTRGEFQE